MEYDFTKRWTGRLGYLYTARSISQFSATFDTGETYFPGGTGASPANDFLAARGDCALVGGALPAGCTLNPDGSITEGSPTNLVPEAGNNTAFVVTNIRENAAVAGFSGRPVDALSITGDFVFGYNSNSFTRIDPRQTQTYKIHTTYKPKLWATLDGAVDINENRNDVAFVANLEHDRMYSFAAMLAPSPRLAIGFGYNYWNVYTQSEICFNYSDHLHESDWLARDSAGKHVAPRGGDDGLSRFRGRRWERRDWGLWRLITATIISLTRA